MKRDVPSKQYHRSNPHIPGKAAVPLSRTRRPGVRFERDVSFKQKPKSKPQTYDTDFDDFHRANYLNYRRKCEELELECAQLKFQRAEVLARSGALHNSEQKIENEIQQLKSQIADMSSEKRRLKKWLKTGKQNRDQLKYDAKMLQNERDGCERELETVANELDMAKKLSKKTKEELDELVTQEPMHNLLIKELLIDGKIAGSELAVIQHEIEKCTAEKNELLELKEEVTSEIEMLKGLDTPQGGFLSKVTGMKLPELTVKLSGLSNIGNIPDVREVKQKMLSWSSERQLFSSRSDNENSVFSMPDLRKARNSFNCWSSERVIFAKNREERELDRKPPTAPLA